MLSLNKLAGSQGQFLHKFGVEDMDVGAPPKLIFRWDRTANTDKEILMHMSSMYRTWRGVLKKRAGVLRERGASVSTLDGELRIEAPVEGPRGTEQGTVRRMPNREAVRQLGARRRCLCCGDRNIP
ncbi:hypothetical protein Taro_016140 [Colocasia esculenta]|uniref:Uncharacterized protein n=1 Tax=Colocasia esculenta TaxID=4460 RepID=A0A843UVD2_COLES|nr:hypothetical protein [Colocasia esculenta]